MHDTTKDCLDEINESVFSCMFDDADESAQIDLDLVCHAELISVSCDTQEEDSHDSDLCLLFEESYDSVHVVSESMSYVDLNERQSEEQFHADDDYTCVVNTSDVS